MSDEIIQVDLTMYAIQSQDGKWFRAKGYGGAGNSWVDDIKNARIYGKPGPARAQERTVNYYST